MNSDFEMFRILSLLICFCLDADELSEALENNKNSKAQWQKFDFNFSKEVPRYNPKELDFKESINAFLSNSLENKNGIDRTDSIFDLENKNISVKNLNSLYESEHNSLLFQKQADIKTDDYFYSNGIIGRYENNDFLLGFNTFIDKKDEQKAHSSLGTEIGYRFFKAYVNSYDSDQKVYRVGINFVLPYFDAFDFDISKDEQKINYGISYSPYSIFNLALVHRNFSISQDEDTAFRLGFSLNLYQRIYKQLKKNTNFNRLNRYDFLEH